MARTGLISLGVLIIAIIGFFIFSRMNKNKKEGFADISSVMTISAYFTGTLTNPTSIGFDVSNNIIVSEATPSIQAIKRLSGTPLTATIIAGVVSSNQSAAGPAAGDGGLATASTVRMWNPQHLVKDSLGNIYFVDTQNSRIRKLTLNTDRLTYNISTIAGNGTYGEAGDGRPATAAAVAASGAVAAQPAVTISPSHLAIDLSGNIYFCNSTRIRKLTLQTDGTYIISAFTITFPAGITCTAPAALEFDSTYNNLYFSCVNRIFKVILNPNKTGGTAEVFAGTGATAAAGATVGDGVKATTATFVNIVSLAFDPLGNLHVLDQGDRKVKKINKTTGFITTVVGSGAAGNTGDGGPALSASLNSPSIIKFDTTGNLYICDQGNNRIRKCVKSCPPGVQLASTGDYCMLISDPKNLPTKTKGVDLAKINKNILEFDPTKQNDTNAYTYNWAGIQGPIGKNPCTTDNTKPFFNFDTLLCEATGNPVTATTTAATTGPSTAVTCPAGQQYNNSKSSCENCPVGQYSTGKLCLKCGQGQTVNAAKNGCTTSVNCCPPTPIPANFDYVALYNNKDCGPTYFNQPALKTPLTPVQKSGVCKNPTSITATNQICFDFKNAFKTPCTSPPTTTSGFEDMDPGETIYSKRQKWFENRQLLNSA